MKRISLIILLFGLTQAAFAKDREPRWFDGERMVEELSVEFAHPPEEVFPLLCPVREYEWMASWKGTTVYAESGFAEPYVVFYHGIPFPFLFRKAYWTATQYVPNRQIQWCVTIPGICIIVIDEDISPLEGDRTRIDYRYTITGISRSGNRLIAKMFTKDTLLKETEQTRHEIDHYLSTGAMLENEYRSEVFN